MSKKGAAIHEDVVEDEHLESNNDDHTEATDEELRKSVVNPNQSFRDALYQRRQEEMSEFDDGESENEYEDDDSEDTTKDVVEPKKIKAKVDGKEVFLTEEELEKKLREYQKHGAADSRLEAASKKLKELEDREKEVARQQQELIDKLEKQNKDVTDKGATRKSVEQKLDQLVLDDELVNTFTREMRDGDEDSAVEAVKNLLKTIMTPRQVQETPDVEALVQRKLEEEQQKRDEKRKAEELKQQELTLQQAEEDFQKKFKTQIESNEDFYDLAVIEDKRLRNDPDWSSKSLSDRFEEAGNRAVNKWFKKTKDKRDKKKGIVNLQGNNSGANIPDGDDVPRAKTPSQVIAEMKKARNQM